MKSAFSPVTSGITTMRTPTVTALLSFIKALYRIPNYMTKKEISSPSQGHCPISALPWASKSIFAAEVLNWIITVFEATHKDLHELHAYLYFSVAPRCGGQLTGSSGNLKSPGYPGNYPNDIECKWTITLPRRFYLVLAFRTFDTERWWVEWNFRLRYLDYYMLWVWYRWHSQV